MQMNQIIFIWLMVCNGNNTYIFLFQNTADYA